MSSSLPSSPPLVSSCSSPSLSTSSAHGLVSAEGGECRSLTTKVLLCQYLGKSGQWRRCGCSLRRVEVVRKAGRKAIWRQHTQRIPTRLAQSTSNATAVPSIRLSSLRGPAPRARDPPLTVSHDRTILRLDKLTIYHITSGRLRFRLSHRRDHLLVVAPSRRLGLFTLGRTLTRRRTRTRS